MTLLKEQLQGFVPTERANEIMKKVTLGSTVLKLSNVQEMKSDTKVFPMLSSGAGAYWVGESERIQTSGVEYIFPEIVAKKLAVIIPVTREKLNDTTIDVFTELEGEISKAFYKAIDSACLFGVASPFTKNIFGAATAAGNLVAKGTNASLDLDVSDVMALVEDEGLDVDAFVGHRGIKNSLRKLRDGNNNALYVDGVNQKELYSIPVEFADNSSFDKTKADLLAGNFDYSIVGIRQGIEYDILKEATLQNTLGADGKPISLAEQDLIAIRATMRLGFLPIKDEAFAALTPQVQA